LVYQIVLRDFSRTGWLIAFVYLLCGALRLARFNCYASSKNGKVQEDFIGFPIPAAAGLIASLTLFMLWLEEGSKEIGIWKYALAGLMLFLSFMMFSRVRYPSFKGLGWRTQRSIPRFLLIIVVLVFSAMFYEWMPALLFVTFLVYGFVRPFISKALRRELEEEEDDEVHEESAK
jgi:CDP-diacylglycerol---serine O-phosphatidyltransferase